VEETDGIWQMIKDIMGDVYAKMLLEGEKEYYKVI
jgi:hypothetical protein